MLVEFSNFWLEIFMNETKIFQSATQSLNICGILSEYSIPKFQNCLSEKGNLDNEDHDQRLCLGKMIYSISSYSTVIEFSTFWLDIFMHLNKNPIEFCNSLLSALNFWHFVRLSVETMALNRENQANVVWSLFLIGLFINRKEFHNRNMHLFL